MDKSRARSRHTRRVALALCCAFAAFTQAQPYPNRPLRLIVPFPPGGGNDILARAVGQRLAEAIGQQVIVDNRGGAGGMVGGQIAATSDPNGYTLFLGSLGSLAHNPALRPNNPYDPPRDFAAVATSLERLAALAGTDEVGKAAAAKFRSELEQLRNTYAARTPVTVFFQVWQAPLMTLNDAHLVSAAMHVCGATNIFGALPQLAPTVSLEAVLQADPDVIASSGSEQSDALKSWRRFGNMRAVARGNLVLLPGDTMTRAGPRIVDATRTLCQKLDAARLRLK